MRFLKSPRRLSGRAVSGRADLSGLLKLGRVAVCSAAIGIFTVAAWSIQQGPASPGNGSSESHSQTVPKDTNEQLEAQVQNGGQQNVAAAGAERKKMIAVEGAQLLRLATDLKMEMDKTSKDTLSIEVIRKADAIEKLTHDVREEKFVPGGAK